MLACRTSVACYSWFLLVFAIQVTAEYRHQLEIGFFWVVFFAVMGLGAAVIVYVHLCAEKFIALQQRFARQLQSLQVPKHHTAGPGMGSSLI